MSETRSKSWLMSITQKNQHVKGCSRSTGHKQVRLSRPLTFIGSFAGATAGTEAEEDYTERFNARYQAGFCGIERGSSETPAGS